MHKENFSFVKYYSFVLVLQVRTSAQLQYTYFTNQMHTFEGKTKHANVAATYVSTDCKCMTVYVSS